MLSMLLKSQKIQSDMAEHGQEAVDKVSADTHERPYDIIFMDFTMPVMVRTLYFIIVLDYLFLFLN